MEALVLLKLNPEHILQFGHNLAASDHMDIVRTCFLHGDFDCALEIHAPTLPRIHEIVESIREMSGVADIWMCTVTQSWARKLVEPVP